MNKQEQELCLSVFNVIAENTGVYIKGQYATEVSFVHEGYGGQSDLNLGQTGQEDNPRNAWVIDYKTKQGDWSDLKIKKKETTIYENHYTQLGAYRKAINPEARCAVVFVNLKSGEIEFVEISICNSVRRFTSYLYGSIPSQSRFNVSILVKAISRCWSIFQIINPCLARMS